MLFEEGIFSVSTHRAKDRGKEDVFRAILRKGPISQKQMLNDLRFRPTDLSNSIRELLADRMIEPYERNGDVKRGRPEIKFVGRKHRIVAIGIYADSWMLRGAVVDLSGQTLYDSEIGLDKEATTAQFRGSIGDMLSRLSTEVPEDAHLSGIGISLPGNVDRARKIWRRSGRWPYVRMLRFEGFEKRFGAPIQLFRDLDAALRGSLALRRALLEKSVVLLHWGVGLGFSYATRGAIVGSSYGRFGAIGYTRIVPDERKPERTRNLADFTNLNFLYTGLRDEFPGLVEDERVFFSLLHDAHITGNPAVSKAMEYMVICLQDISMLLYPDEIMILGPLAENREVLECIKALYRSRPLMEGMERRVRISAVKGGYLGCLTGATYDLLRESLREYLTARF